MKEKVNVKSLVGIAIFRIGCCPSNMTIGIIAYIMLAYSNVSSTTVALIMTMPALVGMIYAFFVGQLNTKIPAKWLAVFSEAALVVYAAVFLFAGGKTPIGVLLAASGLAGFSQGSNYTINGILLRDAVADEKLRSTVMGFSMTLANVGGVIFTVVGGVIAETRWQNAYWIWFVLILFIIAEIICMPNREPEGRKTAAADKSVQKTSSRVPAKVWVVSIHYLFWFLFLYVYGLNVSEYVVTTYQLGTATQASLAASMVTIGGIAAGIVYGGYSKIFRRWSVPFGMLLTFFALAIPFFITTSILAVYIAGFLAGFSMFVASPYITLYMAQIAPGPAYGKAMSIFSAFMNVGMCVAVYVIAFITRAVCGDGTDIHTKFLMGTIGTALCFLASIPIYVKKSRTDKAYDASIAEAANAAA